MNPYEHSDIAVIAYKVIAEHYPHDQESEGKLACLIANALAEAGIELLPPEPEKP